MFPGVNSPVYPKINSPRPNWITGTESEMFYDTLSAKLFFLIQHSFSEVAVGITCITHGKQWQAPSDNSFLKMSIQEIAAEIPPQQSEN